MELVGHDGPPRKALPIEASYIHQVDVLDILYGVYILQTAAHVANTTYYLNGCFLRSSSTDPLALESKGKVTLTRSPFVIHLLPKKVASEAGNCVHWKFVVWVNVCFGSRSLLVDYLALAGCSCTVGEHSIGCSCTAMSAVGTATSPPHH